MYWETSNIPDCWVTDINDNVDAMFVVCDYTKQSLLDSGIKVPVIKVIPAININDFLKDRAPLEIKNLNPSSYKFYSIFQWTARKNPEGLLKAYLSEFTNDENVVLVLKSYLNDTSSNSRDYIIHIIENIKRNLKLENYPSIVFVSVFMTRAEILSLHKSCDCFVLPHRCWHYNSEVLTNNGLKKVPKINKGELVLTHNGRYRKVVDVFKNRLAGRKLIKFKVSGDYREYVATDDHKVFGLKLKASRFPREWSGQLTRQIYKDVDLDDIAEYGFKDRAKRDMRVVLRNVSSPNKNADKEN